MFRGLLSPAAENVVYFQIQISWMIREVRGTKNLCQDVRHANRRGSHYADFTIFGSYLYIKFLLLIQISSSNMMEGRGLDF